MAKKRHHHHSGKPNKPRTTEHSRNIREPVQILAPKPKPEYGQPFILLEDEAKNTFAYQAGKWVPHPDTIAECRIECQVKELGQKINRMTRYEVRRPL